MYLLYYKPFEFTRLNNLEIFNEAFVLANSYLLFIFTDNVDDYAIKEITGYFMICLTLANFACNIAIIVQGSWSNLKLLFEKVKQYLKDLRLKV